MQVHTSPMQSDSGSAQSNISIHVPPISCSTGFSVVVVVVVVVVPWPAGGGEVTELVVVEGDVCIKIIIIM